MIASAASLRCLSVSIRLSNYHRNDGAGQRLDLVAGSEAAYCVFEGGVEVLTHYDVPSLQVREEIIFMPILILKDGEGRA